MATIAASGTMTGCEGCCAGAACTVCGSNAMVDAAYDTIYATFPNPLYSEYARCIPACARTCAALEGQTFALARSSPGAVDWVYSKASTGPSDCAILIALFCTGTGLTFRVDIQMRFSGGICDPAGLLSTLSFFAYANYPTGPLGGDISCSPFAADMQNITAACAGPGLAGQTVATLSL